MEALSLEVIQWRTRTLKSTRYIFEYFESPLKRVDEIEAYCRDYNT